MDQRFTAAQTAFGFDLFQKVVQGEKRGENLFISPSSVAFALAMTYNGAKVETQAAMEDALRLQGMTMEDVNKAAQAWLQALTAQTPKVEMSIANSIWLWQGVPLLPDFTRRVQDAYGARHQPGLQQAGRCGHH
jgi:serpin B